MQTNTKQYTLTETQLAAYIAEPRFIKNSLAFDCKVRAQNQAAHGTPDSGLERLLTVLCAPVQSIALHYTAGEAQVGRVWMAQEGAEKKLAALYRTGEMRRLDWTT